MDPHKYSRYPTYRTLPPPRPPRRGGQRGISKFLLAVFAIGLLALLFRVGLWVHDANRASALEAQAHRRALISAESRDVNSIINANPGISFSVSIKDPLSGLSQHYGTKDAMEAASVGKVITAALYLHRCEEGLDSLGEQISGESARSLIWQMVNRSDDNAWQTLNYHLGHPALEKYGLSLGLSSYDPGTNSISTDDMALLLSKLSSGSLLNSVDSQFLLGAMEHTNYEDIITPAIPTGASIAHKVGEIDDNVNDAAIVTQGSQKIIVVIFTDGHGIQDWPNRAHLMQQVSTAVFRAFLNNK